LNQLAASRRLGWKQTLLFGKNTLSRDAARWKQQK